MSVRERITFSGLVTACLLALVACGASKQEIAAAKHSLYDTDFAIVYSAALEATRESYANLDDSPGPGKISTAWHQVQYSNCAGAGSTCDDMVNQRVVGTGMGMTPGGSVSPAAASAGMPTRLAYKRYYIRFDVTVLGGRPWRVKVIGHASEWEPGNAMPVEMRGLARPHWLAGRTEALQVAIYKRIKQYAIPMKDETPSATPEDELPKTDPTSFKGVPAAAGKRLAGVKDALGKRDYAALRPQLSDDVTWSLGGGTGADAAMATWSADPASFEAMAAVLAGGCAADGDRRVACPGGVAVPGKFQLVVEPRGEAWLVTSFVKAE
jgi:hypothetical protein